MANLAGVAASTIGNSLLLITRAPVVVDRRCDGTTNEKRMCYRRGVGIRTCAVSFVGASGIRHTVEVEAETLYEAAVIAVTRFREDVWGEAVTEDTPLDVEVRAPSTTHSLTLQQVERWLASPGTTHDAARKAKLKLMLVQG